MAGPLTDFASVPSVGRGQIPLAPVRVGVDRRTMKLIYGWPHVEQSMEILFSTRFHERSLRGWVGSNVPNLLGRSGTRRPILAFWSAIMTSLELFEPNYSVRRVYYSRRRSEEIAAGRSPDLTSIAEFRQGHLQFQYDGVYMPRGHLGDKTPETQKGIAMVSENGRVRRTAL